MLLVEIVGSGGGVDKAVTLLRLGGGMPGICTTSCTTTSVPSGKRRRARYGVYLRCRGRGLWAIINLPSRQ
jgi:hypothetical protein